MVKFDYIKWVTENKHNSLKEDTQPVRYRIDAGGCLQCPPEATEAQCPYVEPTCDNCCGDDLTTRYRIDAGGCLQCPPGMSSDICPYTDPTCGGEDPTQGTGSTDHSCPTGPMGSGPNTVYFTGNFAGMLDNIQMGTCQSYFDGAVTMEQLLQCCEYSTNQIPSKGPKVPVKPGRRRVAKKLGKGGAPLKELKNLIRKTIKEMHPIKKTWVNENQQLLTEAPCNDHFQAQCTNAGYNGDCIQSGTTFECFCEGSPVPWGDCGGGTPTIPGKTSQVGDPSPNNQGGSKPNMSNFKQKGKTKRYKKL